MEELEEKLNGILGDSAAMSQIMALAQSLGRSAPPPPEAEPKTPAEPVPPGWEPAGGEQAPDMGNFIQSLDPRLLQMGVSLLREYQSGDQRTAALLQALRPFLRESRRARLDRAVQLTKLSHVIRVALETLGKQGEEGHV